MGPKSLGDRLGISKQEAQALYDQYFQSYSAISVWVDRVTREGKARGYSLSKFGRRFTIWELQSTDAWIYSKGERLCVNAPIQGAAADYMKIAMVRAHKALREAGLLDRVHLVMNIHDALEFYVHESVRPEEVIAVLRGAVVFPIPGFPKIVADWHVGSKWGSLTELRVLEDGTVVTAAGVRLDEEPSQAAPGDGEEGEGGSGAALPLVDSDLLRAAVRRESYAPDNREAKQDHDAAASVVAQVPAVAEVQGSQEERTLVVELQDMPDSAQFSAFLQLLQSRSGYYRVLLRTPEGELVLDAYRTGLTPEDQPQVSMALSGASVRWDAGSVDASSVLEGISI
jgi:hypothetical protein